MDDNHIVGRDGVLVNLDGVGTILLGIGLLDDLGGQFTRLAQGDKTCTQLGSKNSAADKAARLDAHDLGHAFVAVQVGHFFGHDLQGFGVLEGGRQVLELDAWNREVGHVAHHTLHFF